MREAPSVSRPRQLGSGRAVTRTPATSPLHRFALVLVLVAASTAFQLAVPDAPLSRVTIAVLQTATLLLSLRLARAPRALLRAVAVATLAAVAGTVLAGLGGGDAETSLARVLNTCLVVLAPPALIVAVVHEVRAGAHVSLAAVLGVLSVYLLLGMAFGLAYGTIDGLGSTPALSSAPGVSGRADFLYFSFVTLTTTGYGDFVPATDLVRSIAVLEALLGQIYLVTVVALMVGNLKPGSPGSRGGRAARTDSG